ncbi:MAG: hypothetical protein LBH67_02070 [Rickettsia sp.]|nr:hypothetical protein [Rickettsia sp.]
MTDSFCNFLDKRFCFFFLKLEQIFIFQRSLSLYLYYIFFLLSPFSLIKLYHISFVEIIYSMFLLH